MFELPEWTFEFHGHRCPFMPIGYRMGTLMLKTLGAPKAPDHDYFMYTELGVGHPQTCMMDGLQASTGCTYGKLMMSGSTTASSRRFCGRRTMARCASP